MTETAGAGVTLGQIRTPPKGAGLAGGPAPAQLAARLGVRLLAKPLRLGRLVIAARHSQVAEVLARDLDFGIAPVNAGRIRSVSGDFVLGLDRSDQLGSERRALYSALAAIDLSALVAKAVAEADERLAAAGTSIDVVASYARRVAGRTAARLFGIAGDDEAMFLEVARAVFAHTFLNLNDDKAVEARALKAGGVLSGWLRAEIARRREAGAPFGDDLMGALMRAPGLDDDGVRRTLAGMLVGSIDTTASAVAKIIHVLGADATLAARVTADLGDAERLRGWCWEALRRWPHNPLVLREALTHTRLAGVDVPKGYRLVAWTQAAMLDPDAFPAPGQMLPDRSARSYLHFGGGLHPCAGRALNDLQIPMLVGKLLERGLVQVGRIAWAGPFPDHLTVRLGAAR